MSSPWIVPRTPSGPATANRLLIIVENASLRSTLRPKSSFDCLFIFFSLVARENHFGHTFRDRPLHFLAHTLAGLDIAS